MCCSKFARNVKYCSNVAQSAKKCLRVLKMQNGAPNSKRCSAQSEKAHPWSMFCPHPLFSFIAVAASEIVTVISSNSSFISFWRSFRGIVWEVLWTLKLTQSQVGIVGLKIVNSLNRCIKFRKRNRLLVTFVVFFTDLWTFGHLRGSLPKSVPVDFGLEKTFALYFYHQHYYPS